jgi:hypothetical protein
MPKVTYVEYDGTPHEVDVRVSASVTMTEEFDGLLVRMSEGQH